MDEKLHIVFYVATMGIIFRGTLDECANFIDNFQGDWSTIDVGTEQ
jgi:hypothetical protein